jgi:lipoprotein-anchoring transpeptidase ErfK/SrfK
VRRKGDELRMKNHIVVNLTTCRLSYFEEDKLIREYSVGIGKLATPTPAGHYHIIEKLVFEKPVTSEPDFGSRRAILSNEKTCLHGSWNGPVEGHVSGGCVRMYNQDVEELFSKVEVGTPVIMIEG